MAINLPMWSTADGQASEAPELADVVLTQPL
jgi:hypothetical protein